MIRLLKGTIELIDGAYLLIDVNGVGYHVYAAHGILSETQPGTQIRIFIYTHIREDILDLYGFASLEDLKLFEKCLAVSGIGPKTAMNIFTIGSREKIINAITASDIAFFTQVPRLGKKNAQKLIIELKGKIGEVDDVNGIHGMNSADNEVLDALKSFGFSAKEAYEALRSIDQTAATVPEKVRLALKHLGK